MAPRRVSLRYLLAAALLSVGAAGATFHLKHKVRDLERELGEVSAAIAQERWAARSARADLAYLTRPERVVLQAGQLGMVPVRGARLVAARQLATQEQLRFAGAPPLPATLPSGNAVELRLKPPPLFELAGAEGAR
jgi:hypothetical protein